MVSSGVVVFWLGFWVFLGCICFSCWYGFWFGGLLLVWFEFVVVVAAVWGLLCLVRCFEFVWGCLDFRFWVL